MSDISTLAGDQLAQTQPQKPECSIGTKNLFMLLHGSYGNLFLSKFSTGEKDASGKDKGIKSAMLVWDSALREYPADVVEMAAHRARKDFPEFPPSLPQFAALCEANRPREVYQPPNRIEMSQALRSEHAARARAVLAKHHARAAGKEEPELEPGLGPLKRAIANAVATAGGDEAAALLRLDREFERRAQ